MVDLKSTFWNYADYKFLSDNGTVLADHNPITSNFTWTLSSSADGPIQRTAWVGPFPPLILSFRADPAEPGSMTFHLFRRPPAETASHARSLFEVLNVWTE